MTEQSETRRPRGSETNSRLDLRDPRVRAGAVVAVALLVGIGVWLAVRGGGSSSSTASPVPQSSTAVPVSPSGLRTLASAIGQPIYWAGPQPGRQYELTRAQDGRVWVRYLPPSEKIGEQSTPYLTIGTYPVRNAFAVTSSVARQKGSTRVSVGNGGVAFYSAAHPTSVYIAYPGARYQIEVFDPSPGAARQLVASGRIQLVPGAGSATTAPAAGAVALDRSGLQARAAAASAPIYWVGPQPNVTYELTQTAGGRTYVRYLPKGVKAGSGTPYLTVGTYPLKNALAATRVAAKGAGVVTIEVPGGGFGFYRRARPSNVHLAYPGKDYQLEVFDPSAQRARQLVSSGRLRPVG